MEKPEYFTILPAAVRYDPKLSAGAKLLYSEIAALAGSTGCCWATNAYFMRLFEVGESSVIRWIRQLMARGYLKREVEREEEGNMLRRKLTLSHPAPVKNDRRGGQKRRNPPVKNDRENNTRKNKRNDRNYVNSFLDTGSLPRGGVVECEIY